MLDITKDTHFENLGSNLVAVILIVLGLVGTEYSLGENNWFIYFIWLPFNIRFAIYDLQSNR